MPNYLYYPKSNLSTIIMNYDADYVIYIKGHDFCQWMIPNTFRNN